jgi:SAM-dependent methyltransferase/uncharacterized protein YbaR (Trm112 family)
LRIAQVTREEDGHIVEGALHCTNKDCIREFPVVDGVPVIVANIRQYVSDNVLPIYGRRDLGEMLESMLGDCCGPGSAVDITRQQLSSYIWDHYADLDPNETDGEPRPGATAKMVEIGFEEANPVLPGASIDVGCSVGRGSFALAERTKDLVLGVDLNFSMLRLASEVLRRGEVKYARRRVGLVYDRRDFPVRFGNQENVDFWACDAAALPFPKETFSLAVSMNALDCVYDPRELLASLARALKEGGKAVVACPYDWSAAVTAMEAWLGGHSQRSPTEGSCETMLRTLLTPGAHASSITGFKLISERDNLPWQVRLHERSTMTYKLHLVVAVKGS